MNEGSWTRARRSPSPLSKRRQSALIRTYATQLDPFVQAAEHESTNETTMLPTAQGSRKSHRKMDEAQKSMHGASCEDHGGEGSRRLLCTSSSSFGNSVRDERLPPFASAPPRPRRGRTPSVERFDDGIESWLAEIESNTADLQNTLMAFEHREAVANPSVWQRAYFMFREEIVNRVLDAWEARKIRLRCLTMLILACAAYLLAVTFPVALPVLVELLPDPEPPRPEPSSIAS